MSSRQTSTEDGAREFATHFFPARNYNLAETLRSGQAFRWRETDRGWEAVVRGRWVRLRESQEGIEAEAMPSEDGWKWLGDYLQVKIDLDRVIASFPNDEHLKTAVRACRGLRLLKQEPWECLASFILSSTKQIVQIQQIVELLCTRFGQLVPVPAGHSPQHSFPGPERLAALSESDLRACKMGFRAPYLRGTAALVASGEIKLEVLKDLELADARAALMSMPGVGRKIADCVLLFAYGFQQAFPVDVWVLKALRQLYFQRRRPTPRRILTFTETYFGENAGYAQQYLFHYMRTRLRKPKP